MGLKRMVTELPRPCEPNTDVIEGNADIARLGVIVSFIVYISLSLPFTILVVWLDHPQRQSLDPRSWRETLSGVFASILLGLSDTQLVTGFALIIAGYIHKRPLTFHHFMAILQMSGMSLSSHIMVLGALRGHFSRKTMMRRLVRIAPNMILALLWCLWAMEMQTRSLPRPAGCYYAEEFKTVNYVATRAGLNTTTITSPFPYPNSTHVINCNPSCDNQNGSSKNFI